MKSGGSAPPAPDPQASAAAQSGSNIATAIANARLNRVNQTTPWGSINYTQGPADANGVPTYSSEIKLDPQQQAQLDEQRKQQAQRQQIAAALLGNVGTSLSKPLDLSGAHKVYDRYAAPASNSPPAPQPQGQPSAQSGPRDALLAQLMQYLQSQGGAGAPVSGNPAARYGPALNAGSAGAGAAGSPAPSNPTTPALATPAASPAQTWDQFLAGRNPLGSGGYAISDPNDPHYSQNFQTDNPGDNGNELRTVSKNPALGAGGGNVYVNGPDGQPYYQVGGIPNDPSHFKNMDPSAFIYDPQYGVLSPRSNMNLNQDGLDRVMPYLVAAGLGGPAIGAAMGGGGAAAEGALGASGGGSLGAGAGVTGSGALDLGAAATGAGAAATPAGSGTMPMGDLGGAPVSGPAPVTDLSTTAARPSMGSQMMTNLQQGRGLLGMNRGVAGAAGPAIAAILRAMSSQGKGK